jgi:hypothetical protein
LIKDPSKKSTIAPLTERTYIERAVT